MQVAIQFILFVVNMYMGLFNYHHENYALAMANTGVAGFALATAIAIWLTRR